MGCPDWYPLLDVCEYFAHMIVAMNHPMPDGKPRSTDRTYPAGILEMVMGKTPYSAQISQPCAAGPAGLASQARDSPATEIAGFLMEIL
jgi:hypothetical protein